MSSSRASLVAFVCVSVTTSIVSCGDKPAADPAPAATDVQVGALTPTQKVQQRLAACAQDPRVLTGLVSQQICAGADIFLRETFDGNGRTCGTCHPPQNNFTIDPTFINTLPPTDPLFVFKTNPALTDLEREPSLMLGGILENVDDPGTPFADPTHKFSIRSVPHVLAMRTSITADAGDLNATTPPLDRTGWAGDGGALHDFLNTAIVQHYPRTLARTTGADFRLAIPAELDLVDTFQRNLGRTSEPNIQQVNMFDPGAHEGRIAYIDPMRGR